MTTKQWSSELEARDLAQLKKRAKELVRAHANAEPVALAFIRTHHPKWMDATDDEIAAGAFQLSDAQWAIARRLGEPSWPALAFRLDEVPVVPIRSVVAFPGERIALHIGRPRSRVAIDAARKRDGSIAMFAQRAAQTEHPDHEDLHPVGTLGTIVSVEPAGADLAVIVEGKRRIRLDEIAERDGMLVAKVSPQDSSDPVDADAARRSAIAVLETIAKQLQQHDVGTARALVLPHVHLLPPEVQQQMLENDDPAAWVRALSLALGT